MTGKTRSSFLSLAIIAVLVFGVVSPTVAYADDGKPPSPPTEATSACTADGNCPSSNGGASVKKDDAEATSAPAQDPTEAPSTSAPQASATQAATATDATPAPEATSTPDPATTETVSVATETSVVPTDTSAGSPTDAAPPADPATPTPDASVLGQVPENTTVTVLDAQGQSQPLATQDAANAIATTSDPIWCPAGQSPTPGANGCTNSFSSFDALLTFLSGNSSYQGAGTIYIQQGAYNGGESSIDFNSPSYNLSNIRNADLTITGGWNTTTNAVDPTSTSNFTAPLFIGSSTNPWGGSLTINNITINKTTGTGLTLFSQNSITLANVTVTNSVNGAGAELNAGGDVSIRNSKFDRNKTAGAIIKAGGNVGIDSSSFSNPANGRRQDTGLDITSGGGTSLSNVTANENRKAGANINAAGQVTIAGSFFSGTKSMNGSGASTTFFGYGLQVVTPNTISMASVTASDNFLWGASLQADQGVTITDSIFNANTTASPGFIDDTGLLIQSGSFVNLNKIQANDNRKIGATIQAAGDVTIDDSTFSNNRGTTLAANGTTEFWGYGLNVVTPGEISLNLVDASNNTLFGAHLEGGSGVSISASTFNNQTSGSATDQTGRGLEIISGGNVSLINVTLDKNQTFGASIQANGNVFLGPVTATNNGLDGVDAQTSCQTVFLSGGNYSNNGGYGLSITNSQLDQGGSPVFANNGAGDILQDPGTCVFPPANSSTGGNGTGPGSTTTNPLQGASQNNPKSVVLRPFTNSVIGTGASFSGTSSNVNLTLKGFLASVGTTSGNGPFGIFIGKYAFIDSDSGLYIIAFSFPESLVMAEP